jgi:DNA-binding FadR family transcriptional regulator
MHTTYENIPTYYAKLVKQHTEEIRHLEARWNQMHTQRHNAINAGKTDRAEEILAQMLENFKRQQSLQSKINSYVACQCNICR